MDAQHVQTKREITALLAAAGVRPRKRFGQHFLIDGNLMRRLVASAELDPLDLVLEVGGGTGGLTDLIAGLAARQCEGRLVSTLEGGYHLGRLGALVQAHLEGLLAAAGDR